MGERAYTSFRIHPDDIENAAPFLEGELGGEMTADAIRSGRCSDGEDEPGRIIEVEGNYGLTSLRDRMAVAGVRFYGEHGACTGAFPASSYFSDGTVLHETSVDDDGNPSVSLSLPHGSDPGVLLWDSYAPPQVVGLDALQEWVRGAFQARRSIDTAWKVRIAKDERRRGIGDLIP